MSQTRVQKHVTVSKVAADWHELMIPQRIMRPSIAHHCWICSIASEQLDTHADIPLAQSATLGLHPVACKLLLISHPMKGRRLSWPAHRRLATCSELLAYGPHWDSNPQPESYESDTLTTRPLTPTLALDVYTVIVVGFDLVHVMHSIRVLVIVCWKHAWIFWSSQPPAQCLRFGWPVADIVCFTNPSTYLLT